jgi:hypothetical protein
MVLFIGGHIRSGTTLLRNLCNSHPEAAITDEFNYFSGLGKTYLEHRRILLKVFLGKTIETNRTRLKWHLRNFIFVVRYLSKMRRYREGLIDVAAIEATLRSIFPEARIVGDKTPRYVFSLDELAGKGQLSGLIIFRDCRDVTSSTLERVRTRWGKKSWKQTVDTAEKIARRWVRCIALMEHHKDKVHIIRYEDLVQEPRRELRALGEWLGIDSSGFSESMIRSIRNTGIGKYKTGLSEEELKTVMEIAGPTMARLGYI